MKLVERHIIKQTDCRYKELDKLCFLSKNLYNAALYEVRQQFFKDKTFVGYYELNRRLHDRKDENYFALPSNASQEVLKLVAQNYKSFFQLLKSKKAKNAKIPKYLDKQKGRQILVYNASTLSKKNLDTGIIKLAKSNITFKTQQTNIKQIRIIPKNCYIVAEIIYDKQENELKADNGRYLSIDLGIDNLATCTSNVAKAFIVNGKPAKSINQYYNKKKAELQSKLPNGCKTSNRIQRLSLKRANKINDYFHKASSYIVNYAVSHAIATIVVGKNNGWKQNTTMGKANNQNFVFLPFNRLMHMIEYKAKLHGINVAFQEESYTSKASFFDNDFIPTYGDKIDGIKFSGKRIKRGLYKTKTSALVNADVNGSLNILRKHLNVASNALLPIGSRGLVVRPFKLKTFN